VDHREKAQKRIRDRMSDPDWILGFMGPFGIDRWLRKSAASQLTPPCIRNELNELAQSYLDKKEHAMITLDQTYVPTDNAIRKDLWKNGTYVVTNIEDKRSTPECNSDDRWVDISILPPLDQLSQGVVGDTWTISQFTLLNWFNPTGVMPSALHIEYGEDLYCPVCHYTKPYTTTYATNKERETYTHWHWTHSGRSGGSVAYQTTLIKRPVVVIYPRRAWVCTCGYELWAYNEPNRCPNCRMRTKSIISHHDLVEVFESKYLAICSEAFDWISAHKLSAMDAWGVCHRGDWIAWISYVLCDDQSISGSGYSPSELRKISAVPSGVDVANRIRAAIPYETLEQRFKRLY